MKFSKLANKKKLSISDLKSKMNQSNLLSDELAHRVVGGARRRMDPKLPKPGDY